MGRLPSYLKESGGFWGEREFFLLILHKNIGAASTAIQADSISIQTG